MPKPHRAPTISKGRVPVTLINVFTVKPGRQDELITLLKDVTERHVKHCKGFISASLHRGIDGKKVTMYAQWGSIDDCEVMRKDTASARVLEKSLQLGKLDPGIYEVAEIFTHARNRRRKKRERGS
jgi:quinol monooxygenase YgiN